MAKLFYTILLLAGLAGAALAQSGNQVITLQEIDGSPSRTNPKVIKVSNGTLSCTGNVCTITIAGGGGSGTVTSVSVTTANGVSGSVATATTTPAITLTLGAITPTTVNGLTISTSTGTLTVANGKTVTHNATTTFGGTDGKTLTISKSLTLDGTDSTTMTFPATSDTVAGLGTVQSFTAAQTFSAKPLTISGNNSAAAWTTTGIALSVVGATYTDTSSSGTVASMGVTAFGTPTLIASSATTYTNSATVYIAGPPTSSTNVTQSNPAALTLASGNLRLVTGTVVVAAGGVNALSFGNVSATSTNITMGNGAHTIDIRTNATSRMLFGSAGSLTVETTNTAAGTTGARTINKMSGAVNFAATDTSLVVTNSLVTAASMCIATVQTNDSTLKSVQCVPASGSFTLFGNAAAAAETRVAFWVIN